jgi:hypothetical protein
MYPLLNTTVGGVRPSPGGFQSLPIYRRIYPNLPVKSPQFPSSGDVNEQPVAANAAAENVAQE